MRSIDILATTQWVCSHDRTSSNVRFFKLKPLSKRDLVWYIRLYTVYMYPYNLLINVHQYQFGILMYGDRSHCSQSMVRHGQRLITSMTFTRLSLELVRGYWPIDRATRCCSLTWMDVTSTRHQKLLLNMLLSVLAPCVFIFLCWTWQGLMSWCWKLFAFPPSIQTLPLSRPAVRV